MPISTQLTLQIASAIDRQHLDNDLPSCVLKWRQGQLFVSLAQQANSKQAYVSVFESEQGLVACLKQSPVRLVRLDPNLGEALLQRWADACEQANKPVFLRKTLAQKLSRMSKKQSKFRGQLNQLINSIIAFLLLIALSPVMLVILALMSIYSPGSIFSKQWCIGPRGKFFRLLKFRTMRINDNFQTTVLGYWLRKYSLDKLPQLLNVLRGEMSLLGSPSLTVSEAVQSTWECQQQLKTLLEIKQEQQTSVSTSPLRLFKRRSRCDFKQLV